MTNFIKKIEIDCVGVTITTSNTNNYKEETQWWGYECDENLEVIMDCGNGYATMTKKIVQ